VCGSLYIERSSWLEPGRDAGSPTTTKYGQNEAAWRCVTLHYVVHELRVICSNQNSPIMVHRGQIKINQSHSIILLLPAVVIRPTAGSPNQKNISTFTTLEKVILLFPSLIKISPLEIRLYSKVNRSSRIHQDRQECVICHFASQISTDWPCDVANYANRKTSSSHIFSAESWLRICRFLELCGDYNFYMFSPHSHNSDRYCY
jgi:hypothetical protein